MQGVSPAVSQRGNNMKKYIRLLPLIIYPYAYILQFILEDIIETILKKNWGLSFSIDITISAAVFTTLTLIIAISSTVLAVKGKYTSLETAKMNLAVKAWHIPAYLLHFAMFCMGFIAGIWGVAFVMIAIIVDVLTIALSGINAISCAAKLKKDGIISKGMAIFLGICSFIFCIDLIVAIVYVRKAKKQLKNNT